MTSWQRAVKYIAMAFAALICISIFGAIAGTVSIFMPSETKITKDPTEYPVKSTIYDLYIDANTSNVEIVTGDTFKISSNIKNIRITEHSDYLSISEDELNFNPKRNKNAKITIYIPENMGFNKVSIEGGVGNIKINSLLTDSLDINLGAGVFSADNLTAYKDAIIDGGAGKFSVSNGIIKNLDFSMGTGKAEIRSKFKGECSFDLGVGNASLNVIGAKKDYEIDIDKGLGKITLDNEEISDDFSINENVRNQIEVDCGIGNTDIIFEEK